MTMIDPITSFWVIAWTGICPLGIYILVAGDGHGASFYVYGKSLDATKKKGLFWKLFLLPKRYFWHFYLCATIIFSTSLAVTTIYYIPRGFNPELSMNLKDFKRLFNKHLHIQVVDDIESIASLTFTLIIMIIQTSRRLYESLFVSVFADSSKINLIHYLFGHAFYIFAALSTICPLLLSDTSAKFTIADLLDNLITKQRALAFILIVYASHQQHKCHLLLANLRKDKSGNVITDRHYVPTGGLFEYVTCPHFFLEVVIYFLIILSQNFSGPYWNKIFILVISTQTINAINELKWYKKKYKDYPTKKKAIFPWLL